MTTPENPTPTNPSPSNAGNPSPSQAAGQGGASSPTRPDWLPEAHWDTTSNAIKPEFGQHFAELTTLKATHDARIAARPEKADGYELKFPDGYTPAQAVQWDANDPRLAGLREFAHKNNWSQAEFGELLKIEHQRILADTKAYDDAVAAEKQKLGPNGPARMTAIKTWMSGVLGKEGADDMLGTDDKPGLVVFSEAAVKHLEKMLLAFSSQGAGSYSNGGREPPAPPPQSLEERFYPQQARKAS